MRHDCTRHGSKYQNIEFIPPGTNFRSYLSDNFTSFNPVCLHISHLPNPIRKQINNLLSIRLLYFCQKLCGVTLADLLELLYSNPNCFLIYNVEAVLENMRLICRHVRGTTIAA